MKRPFQIVLLISTVWLYATHNVIAQKMTQEHIQSVSKELLIPALEELKSFLEVPNNGRIQEHVNQNVEWCRAWFTKLGFSTQVLQTEGQPIVFAEYIFKPNQESILFYMQIDGQPVDSSQWDQKSPYEPVLKRRNGNAWEKLDWNDLKTNPDLDSRIFARSAADSKGPAMAFMSALKFVFKEGIEPDFNVKVIMDFQEELGSPDLPAAVDRYKEYFKAKMMLIMDGTRFLNNMPTLTFGARGIARVNLRVFGAKENLHSGHYGNFSPNPVFGLSKLLAGMKDDEGKVIIPGYYDGIEISAREKALMNETREDIEGMKRKIGIAEADQVGTTYQEALQYPSLNVRGLRAAWVGKEARTIIPNEALAELDLRLVPESDGQRQVDLIKRYISDAGYHFVEGEPTEAERAEYSKLISFTYTLGSKAFRTDLNSDIGVWLDKSMTHTFGKGNYVKLRTTGGSQPIAPFISTLNVPAVSIRIPDPASSIHAPNENIRVGNFLEGIQMCLAILTQDFE